jgi:hypothetical protein
MALRWQGYFSGEHNGGLVKAHLARFADAVTTAGDVENQDAACSALLSFASEIFNTH